MRQTRTDFRRYSAQKKALDAHPYRAGLFSIQNPAPVLGRYAGLGIEDDGIDLTPVENDPRPWATDGCKEFANQKFDGKCVMPPLAPASDLVPNDPVKREQLRRQLFDPNDASVGNLGGPQERRIADNAKFFNSLSDAELEKQFRMYMGNVMACKGAADQLEEKYKYALITGDTEIADWSSRQINNLKKLAGFYARNAVLARRIQLLRQGRDFSTSGPFQGLGLGPIAWLVAAGFTEGMATVLVWTGVIAVSGAVVAGTGAAIYHWAYAPAARDYRRENDKNLQAIKGLKKALREEKDCRAKLTEEIKQNDPNVKHEDAFREAFKRCHAMYKGALSYEWQYENAEKNKSLMDALFDMAYLAGGAMVAYAFLPLIKETIAGATAKKRKEREGTEGA